MKKFTNIQGVVDWRLCVGCGACAYACPQGNIELQDLEREGLRPSLKAGRCQGCGTCLAVCPGLGVARQGQEAPGSIRELFTGWGTVLEVLEGYAVDPELRYQGSSGGLITALALYGLEKGGLAGALHIGADPEQPWKNVPGVSQNRDQLLHRAGSRYAPAAPCAGLGLLESAPGSLAFIGKPCDLAGLSKTLNAYPDLAAKVGLTLGIFCAGTPSTQATVDLLKKMKVDPSGVHEVRYRGRGWPGSFRARPAGGGRGAAEMPYEEAWSFLEKYRPYRCYLCPDATSELADISCGDPWYRERQAGEAGVSLVLVRTEKGRDLVRGARQTGYVQLEPRNPRVLVESQKGILNKRGAIWGRLLTMKAFGLPTPGYEGFPLYLQWKDLPWEEKVRSILGTGKRIVRRKYFLPQRLAMRG